MQITFFRSNFPHYFPGDFFPFAFVIFCIIISRSNYFHFRVFFLLQSLFTSLFSPWEFSCEYNTGKPRCSTEMVRFVFDLNLVLPWKKTSKWKCPGAKIRSIIQFSHIKMRKCSCDMVQPIHRLHFFATVQTSNSTMTAADIQTHKQHKQQKEI